MSLLVLILALIVWRGMKLSVPDFCDKWINLLHTLIIKLPFITKLSPVAPFWIILALVVLDVIIIHLLLNDLMWDIPLALAQAALLFYAFGRRHSNFSYDDYIAAWKNADTQSVKTIATIELRLPKVTYATSLEDFEQKSRTGILYRAFSDMYVILFWFVISGVYGPVIYRICVLLLEKFDGFPGYQKIEKLLYYFEWLPVRLLGMTFAITGQFEPAFEWCSKFKTNYELKASEVLIQASHMACGLNPLCSYIVRKEQWRVSVEYSIEITNQLLQLKELLGRSFQIWFVIIIILSLLGAFT